MLPIMYSDTTRGSTVDAGSRMTPRSAECKKALSTEEDPVEDEMPPLPWVGLESALLVGGRACYFVFGGGGGAWGWTGG